MTLVDSSAWVELFRATGSPTARALRKLLRSDQVIATSEPVEMELFAGATTMLQRRRIAGSLSACRRLSVLSGDWEDAAGIFLACRREGGTPRNMIDCLIAAVAIRNGAPVLARDRDYPLIAGSVPLELA